jgi:hypothetical protein
MVFYYLWVFRPDWNICRWSRSLDEGKKAVLEWLSPVAVHGISKLYNVLAER